MFELGPSVEALRIGEVLVVELERANESWLWSQFLEAMEHKDAVATAVSPDFEAGLVCRKRVGPDWPARCRVNAWTLALVVAIVHD